MHCLRDRKCFRTAIMAINHSSYSPPINIHCTKWDSKTLTTQTVWTPRPPPRVRLESIDGTQSRIYIYVGVFLPFCIDDECPKLSHTTFRCVMRMHTTVLVKPRQEPMFWLHGWSLTWQLEAVKETRKTDDQ